MIRKAAFIQDQREVVMRAQPAKTGRTRGAAAEREVTRAVIQDHYGSADRLRLAQIDKPVIAPREVLVQCTRRAWTGAHVT